MSSMINEELKSVEKQSLVDNIRDAEKKLKNATRKNFGIIKEVISIIFFAMFTFAILGIVSLIDGEYDITKLGDLAFWGNWAIVQIASIFSKLYATLFRKRQLEKTNSIYLHLQSEIKKYVEKDSKTPFISRFALIDTRIRKEHSFTTKQKIKILRLARKYEIINSLEHLKKFDNKSLKISELKPFELQTSIIYTNEKKQARWLLKQRKINDKINAIFITISQEWLDENLDTQKVKYNEVTKSLLVSGHEKVSNDKIGFTYKSSPAKSFVSKNAPMFLFSMIFLVLIHPILGSGFVKDASAWLNFIVNVFLVVISFVFSLYNGHELFEKDILQPLIERETTLSEYNTLHNEELKKGL